MRKIVGKDGDKINAVKLCKDFEDAGLKDFLVEVDPETKDVYVSYELPLSYAKILKTQVLKIF